MDLLIQSAINTTSVHDVALDLRIVRNAVSTFFPEDLDVSVCTKDACTWNPSTGAGSLAQLKVYKGICDELLPAMRKNSHLHNLIFRFAGNYTMILHRKGEPEQVLGGSTFRIIRTGSHYVVLDVLLMVVAQRVDVCGQGHGTRIVNLVKYVAKQQVLRQDGGCFIATQADIGPSAIQFWQKQQLTRGPSANGMIAALHRLEPSRNHVYESSFPMVGLLTTTSEYVEPGHSTRAKRGQDFAIDCTCNGAVDDDRLVSCDYCGGRHHYECVKDLLLSSTDDSDSSFMCHECTAASDAVKKQPRSRSAAAALRRFTSPDSTTPTAAAATGEEPGGLGTAAITAGKEQRTKTYTCTFPNCKRVFKKQGGRKMHFTKIHGKSVQQPQHQHQHLDACKAVLGPVGVVDTDTESDTEDVSDSYDTDENEGHDAEGLTAAAAAAASPFPNVDRYDHNTVSAPANTLAMVIESAAGNKGFDSGLSNQGADNASLINSIGDEIAQSQKRRRLNGPNLVPKTKFASTASASSTASTASTCTAFKISHYISTASTASTNRSSSGTLRIGVGACITDQQMGSTAAVACSNQSNQTLLERSLALVWRMHDASDLDMESGGIETKVTHQPACAKLLQEELLLRNGLSEDQINYLLDTNVLGALKRWLAPTPNCPLPDLVFRTEILGLLLLLSTKACLKHIKRSDGLLRVLRQYRSCGAESASNKARASEILKTLDGLMFAPSEVGKLQRSSGGRGVRGGGDRGASAVKGVRVDRSTADGSSSSNCGHSNSGGQMSVRTVAAGYGGGGSARVRILPIEGCSFDPACRDDGHDRNGGGTDREGGARCSRQVLHCNARNRAWNRDDDRDRGNVFKSDRCDRGGGGATRSRWNSFQQELKVTTKDTEELKSAHNYHDRVAPALRPQFCPLPSRFPPPPPPPPQQQTSVDFSSTKADKGGRNGDRGPPPRIRLAYATYSELVASTKDFKRMTDISFGHTLNCKRIIAEMVKVLIKPVYKSNRIDKAVFKYLCESVTKEVTSVVRTSTDYDYKQVPFPPSESVFIKVVHAIQKSLGAHP